MARLCPKCNNPVHPMRGNPAKACRSAVERARQQKEKEQEAIKMKERGFTKISNEIIELHPKSQVFGSYHRINFAHLNQRLTYSWQHSTYFADLTDLEQQLIRGSLQKVDDLFLELEALYNLINNKADIPPHVKEKYLQGFIKYGVKALK